MNDWFGTVAEALLNATWIGAVAHLTAWATCRLPAAGPHLRATICLAALLAAAAMPWLQRVDWPTWSTAAAAPAPVHSAAAIHLERLAFPPSGIPSADEPSSGGMWQVPAGGPLVQAAARMWLLGALALTCHVGVRVAKALRLKCHAERPTGRWAEREARWRSDAGRRARLLLSRGIDAPVAIGWLRPAILFPPDLDKRLSEEELERLWLHEAAHLERWDDWLVLIERLSVAPLWFHPSAWSLAAYVAAQREMACDALAAERSGSRREYARTLTRLAELRIARGVAPALSIAGESSLSRRIEMLLNDRPPGGRLGRAGVALAATACTASLAGVLTVGPLIGLAQTPPPAPPADAIPQAPAWPAVAAPPEVPSPPAHPPTPTQPRTQAQPPAPPHPPMPTLAQAPEAPPAPQQPPAPAAPAAPAAQPAPKPVPAPAQVKPPAPPPPPPMKRGLDREAREEIRQLSEELRKMGDMIREQVERDIRPFQEQMRELGEQMRLEGLPFGEEMRALAQTQAELSRRGELTQEERRALDQTERQMRERSKEFEAAMEKLRAQMHSLEVNLQPNQEALRAIEEKMRLKAEEIERRIEEKLGERRRSPAQP